MPLASGPDLIVALAAGSASIGVVDTELPAAVALTADALAAPTAPMVGAIMLGVDQGSSPFTFSPPRLHTASSDGRSNGITGLVTQSRLYIHNNNTPGSGTSDIVRSSSAAANNSGTGILATGPLGLVTAYSANPSALTAGNYGRVLVNRHGVLMNIGGHPNVICLAQNYTGAQTDAALVTISTGSKIAVTSIMAICSAANTVNVSFRAGFGTANTPAYNANGLLLTHPNIPPGSGAGRGDGGAVIGIGADNEDLRITCSVPTGGSIDVIVSYFTIDS